MEEDWQFGIIIKYLKRKKEKRFDTEVDLIEFLLSVGDDFYKNYLRSKEKAIKSLEMESLRRKNIIALLNEIDHEENMVRELNEMTKDGSIFDSQRGMYSYAKSKQNKRKQQIYDLIELIDSFKRNPQ